LAIDFDLKYDTSGTLWEDFKKSANSSVLKKCRVHKTKNNGYHLIFKTEITNLQNKKLANRETTDDEKKDTLLKSMLKYPNDFSKALKTSINDKVRVLIETRANGGYIAIPPTAGYKVVHDIPFKQLSEAETNHLLEVARSFNSYIIPVVDYNRDIIDDKNDNIFNNYNKTKCSLQVLKDNGWEEVSRNENSARLKRPGQTSASSSALYDLETKVFTCFSTSTEFDPGKSYLPIDVLAMLNFNGDYKQTLKFILNK
jgi:uncharacterized FlaG/YvyC family protein